MFNGGQSVHSRLLVITFPEIGESDPLLTLARSLPRVPSLRSRLPSLRSVGWIVGWIDF